MTELEAKRILGRELAESWLRMPEASRDTLRLLLTEDELRAVAVLEGHPLPDPPPPADLDSVLKLITPAPQAIAVAAPPVEQVEVQLPEPDFMRLLSLPLPDLQLPVITQAELHLPEPDFSYLYRSRTNHRHRRFYYRPERYCRPVDPSSRCLTRLAWSIFWITAMYLAGSLWRW
jgi:hypothetical protein